MTAYLTLGGGFLLAVIWMDLMFDVQALRGPRTAPLPEPALASIAGYYRRVTTDAWPMNQLVGVVMTGTVLGSVTMLVRRRRGVALATPRRRALLRPDRAGAAPRLPERDPPRQPRRFSRRAEPAGPEDRARSRRVLRRDAGLRGDPALRALKD